MGLLYTDDLVLKKQMNCLTGKVYEIEARVEMKGLRVEAGMTKVMLCLASENRSD